MDPLVRGALWVQRTLAQVAGSALALGLGAYLVEWAGDRPPEAWNAGALALLVACAAAVVTWNAMGARPGVYFARLEAAGEHSIARFVRLP